MLKVHHDTTTHFYVVVDAVAFVVIAYMEVELVWMQ
jgi:hypothetical protein